MWKIDKSVYRDRELKKLSKMRVSMVPIVNAALGTVLKDLEKGPEELEIRGKIVRILTTAVLRSIRILTRVMKPKDTCCHLVLNKKQTTRKRSVLISCIILGRSLPLIMRIQATAVLRSIRILTRVMKPKDICCHLVLNEKNNNPETLSFNLLHNSKQITFSNHEDPGYSRVKIY